MFVREKNQDGHSWNLSSCKGKKESLYFKKKTASAAELFAIIRPILLHMQQSTPSYFSDTDTHIPMQEACGRSDKHSVLKCIWKHQYHISCGLYFQAKAQNSTLFLLFDILWSVVCRQVFYLVFYIWRITESSRVPNIHFKMFF